MNNNVATLNSKVPPNKPANTGYTSLTRVLAPGTSLELLSRQLASALRRRRQWMSTNRNGRRGSARIGGEAELRVVFTNRCRSSPLDLPPSFEHLIRNKRIHECQIPRATIDANHPKDQIATGE